VKISSQFVNNKIPAAFKPVSTDQVFRKAFYWQPI